jgi:hypothetical protein
MSITQKYCGMSKESTKKTRDSTMELVTLRPIIKGSKAGNMFSVGPCRGDVDKELVTKIKGTEDIFYTKLQE